MHVRSLLIIGSGKNVNCTNHKINPTICYDSSLRKKFDAYLTEEKMHLYTLVAMIIITTAKKTFLVST
jgi:bifunctional pyridoxal-dependent enzyme with beta-cystathionase and maltose regulon repressor activities